MSTEAALPPVPLGTWPTPLEPAPGLARALGLSGGTLRVKRDDLTGLGGGGNKVRKLRYAIARALDAGATTVVTTGAAQSNHARLTAAAAARHGLKAVLVLRGEAPDAPRGNLLLDQLTDATIVWAGDRTAAELETEAARVAQRLRDSGETAYVIPYGGSDPHTSQGYADCAAEIEQQWPGVDLVVVAVGSGGTMAGLVAALGAQRVLGVDVGAVPDPRAQVGKLLAGMGVSVAPEELLIDRDRVGDGYPALTPAAQEAMRLVARTEGIFLDPVYTARAMAGLIAAAAEGRITADQRVVFLHTGGLPGLFGHTAFA